MVSVNDIKDRVRTIISALLKGPVCVESTQERAFLQYIGRMTSQYGDWIIQDRRDDSQMQIIQDDPEVTSLQLNDFMHTLDDFLDETNSQSYATRSFSNQCISIYISPGKSATAGRIHIYSPFLYYCIVAYFGDGVIQDNNELCVVLNAARSDQCISVLFPLVKLTIT